MGGRRVRPLRLWASNYGPYGSVDWRVPTGVTAILGRNDSGDGISSNGSGKTKLLEILPIALFGPELSWSEYLSKSSEDAVCEVGCEFDHAGELYRVVRTFSAKGRGKSTLQLELCRPLGAHDEAEHWVSLTRESQSETQEELQRILGLTEATFQHSAFSKQGARHFADPELAPRERKEILAQALGLGIYDTLLELAREELAAVRASVTEAEGALVQVGLELPSKDEAAAALKEATDNVVDLQTSLVAAHETHDSLRASYEQARTSRERVAEAQRALTADRAHQVTLQQKHDAGVQAQDDAMELTARLESLQDVPARLEALVADLSALQASQRQRDTVLRQHQELIASAQESRRAVIALEADAADWGRRIETLETQVATPPEECDKCGQPLADAARFLENVESEKLVCEMNREQRMADAQTARAAAADAVAEADGLVIPPEVDRAEMHAAEALIDRLRADVTEAAVMRERLAALTVQADAAADPDFQRQLAEAQRQVLITGAAFEEAERAEIPDGAVQELARDVNQAQLELEGRQRELDAARVWLGKAEALVEQVDATERRLHDLREQVVDLTRRQEVLRDLEHAYGRDGIPALIMESTAIPKIEREAERVLGELGVPYRVELRTQAALKTADRMRDTLEVVVHEPRGERRYETYSGGERARVNVALRIALSRLLAHRGGASIEVFALDEVEHLDAAGVTRLAELLKDLQREVPVVLLVSHVDALTDQFDNQVVVEKRDGVSHLVEV